MESWAKTTMPQSSLFTGKREDWLMYAHRLKAVAIGIKGLLDIPDFLNMDSDTPAEHENYRTVNARFFMVVANSIAPGAIGATRIVMQHTDTLDGRAAYKALESAFAPNTTFNKLQLHSKLANPVRESGEDITAYALRLINLRDELRIKEGNHEVWPDLQLLEALLRGLHGDSTFDTTIEIINTTDGITLDRAVELLRQAEERARAAGSSGTALTATSSNFAGTCHRCGEVGHKRVDCPLEKKKGEQQRGGGSRGQRGWRGGKGKPRGDPRKQAGAGSTGKYCPLHPMARHDAKECRQLKQHPHLATALAAAAAEASSGDAAGSTMPNFRPLALCAGIPEASDALGAAWEGEAHDCPSSVSSIEYTAPLQRHRYSGIDAQRAAGLTAATVAAAVEQHTALLATKDEPGELPLTLTVDSGATTHYVDPMGLCWDLGVALTDISPLQQRVKTGGGACMAVAKGTLHLLLHTASGEPLSLALQDTLVVPGLGHHLLSVSGLRKQGVLADFGALVLRGRSGKAVPFNLGKEGLYKIRVSALVAHPGVSRAALITAAEQALLWHERLGHVNWEDLKRLASTSGTGVLLPAGLEPPSCATCPMGKSKHTPHPSRARQDVDRFELLHSDWAGPVSPSSLAGNNYPHVFVDDSSNYGWLYFSPDRPTDRVINHLNTLISNVAVSKGLHLKALHFDCAKEFSSAQLKNYAEHHGINLSWSSPYTPQENGVAERRWQVLFNMARCWLEETGAPKELWEEAMTAANYIVNRLPSKALGGLSPYEVWHGRTPSLAHTRKWGSHAFVHAEGGTKLQPKAWRGILVGYGQREGEYRVYNPSSGTVHDTRHVTFVEQPPPRPGTSTEYNFNFNFKKLRFGATAAGDLHPAADGDDFDYPPLLSDSEGEDEGQAPPASGDPQEAPAAPEGAPNAGEAGAAAAEEPGDGEQQEGAGAAGEPPMAAAPPATAAPPAAPRQRYVPAWKRPRAESVHSMSVRKPPGAGALAAVHALLAAPTDTMPPDSCTATALMAEAYATVAGGVPTDPQSYKEALSGPHAAEWQEAMRQEYDALVKMGCWEVVPAPSGVKVVGSRWVFKSKLDSNNLVARRKARFVAKGFTQRIGEHYDQTFSPVVQGVTLRCMLALAAHRGWVVHQLDFNNAFINANIDGTVYLEQPEGFIQPGPDGARMVLRLRRSLYGLAQSPRLWCQEVSQQLAELGYISCGVDPCLFTNLDTGVLLLLYVDDLLLTGTDNTTTITAAVKQLAQRFSVKNLGAVQWFLGMSINISPGCVALDQDSYVRVLLSRFGMDNCNVTDTPAALGDDGGKEAADGEQLEARDALLFRSLVGGLLYVAVNTRPDIAHTVSSLARHMQAPTAGHWRRARRVLRYLKGNPGGLVYTAQQQEPALMAFADASFATDINTGKSTTGFALLLCGAAVAWRSKLQSVVAQSTAEAEYIALALAGAEVYWVRQLLAFANCKQDAPTPIYEDNVAALQLASNPLVQQRTRTINVKYHYIRQLVGSDVVDVLSVRTGAQAADILTKTLSRAQHKLHASTLLGRT